MAIFTGGDLTLGVVAVVRILGIDPGTVVVGYGVLEVAIGGSGVGAGSAALPLALRASNVVHAGAGTGDVRLVAAGVLRLGGRGAELPHRLLALAMQFRSLLAAQVPTELALEQAFQGKSVQAALRIGEARGVVLAEAAAAGLAVHQFAPARVKRCVTGNGAAAKESVAAMVQHLVRRAGQAIVAGLPADATDAVAVAWTRVEERRSPLASLGT
jgi:crossover junction endodeoxyribonuclease RuvC